MRIENMTRVEIEVLLSECSEKLAIIPTGAIEQHGLHLPLETDTLIIKEVVRKLDNLSDINKKVLFTPPVVFGNSHHHFPYPSLSLKSATYIYLIEDIIESLFRMGFKHIFILNSHGGNDGPNRIVAGDLSRKYSITISSASYWTIAWDKLIQKINPSEIGRVPGHAGGFETSIIKAIDESLVRDESYPQKRTDKIPKKNMTNRIYTAKPRDTVGKDGYSDDASAATRELGNEAIRIIINALHQEIKELLVSM